MEVRPLEQEKAAGSRGFLGMVLFLISEAFLFGSLFWTYYYLRATAPAWPPAGTELDMPLASLNTAVLLAGSVVIWLSGRAIRRQNEAGLARGLLITLLLAAVFLGITVWEWTHLNFRPWTSAYGSIFYTLTGFHALHVFGGLVLMLALLLRTRRQRFTATHYGAVELGALYWHYVDLIWLFVFSTLFIIR